MLKDHAGLPEAQSPRSSSSAAGTISRVVGVAAVALLTANCSQQKLGRMIDPKYGVAPSPRVVADGQPVPKGGGRELVGKPYVVAGRTYVPDHNPNYASEGLASWYGSNFHGRLTANGEVFDRESIAAAHTTMPLPSYARVTNLYNGRSIIVRVNDRGPYHGNRVIDVSEKTADALDFKRNGTARVRVEYVGRASVSGSDDRILLASLRTDGQPATLSGATNTMIASNAPAPAARGAMLPRSFQPDEMQEVPEGQPSSSVMAFAPTAVRPGSVPLPPERPFDLGTIPHAATPISVVGSVQPTMLPPMRPVVAGL
jgi:rare lipoprotein A